MLVWGGPSGRMLNVGEGLAERLSAIRILEPQIAPNLEARSSDTLTTTTKDCRAPRLESWQPFPFLPQRSRNLWRDKGDAQLGRELDQVPEGRSAVSCPCGRQPPGRQVFFAQGLEWETQRAGIGKKQRTLEEGRKWREPDWSRWRRSAQTVGQRQRDTFESKTFFEV